jgi:hypothetical protein
MLRTADDFAVQQTLYAASQMSRISFVHERAEPVGDESPFVVFHFASELG